MSDDIKAEAGRLAEAAEKLAARDRARRTNAEGAIFAPADPIIALLVDLTRVVRKIADQQRIGF